MSQGEVENSEFSGNSEILGESVFRGFSLRVSHLAQYPTPKTRVENLGVLSEALWSDSKIFQFRVFHLHYTQNGKLGVENLRVFYNVYPNNDIIKLCN